MKFFEKEITTRFKRRITEKGKQFLMGFVLIVCGSAYLAFLGTEDATPGVLLIFMGMAVSFAKSLN